MTGYHPSRLDAAKGDRQLPQEERRHELPILPAHSSTSTPNANCTVSARTAEQPKTIGAGDPMAHHDQRASNA